jgi:hypothetical protein
MLEYLVWDPGVEAVFNQACKFTYIMMYGCKQCVQSDRDEVVVAWR